MKKALLFIAIVLVVGLGVYAIIRNNPKTDTKDQNTNTAKTNTNKNSPETGGYKDIKSTAGSDLILYVGDGRDQGENACPHCVKVEEFIKSNKIDEKLALDVKEVWYNKENSSELNETAKICKIPQNDIGVPLLLDKPNSKCYVGQDEIDNCLSQKAEAGAR